MLCYSDVSREQTRVLFSGMLQWLKTLSKMLPTYSAYGIFGFGVLHGLLLAMIEQGTIKVHITLSVSSCSNLATMA